MERNLLITQYFQFSAAKRTPKYRFSGSNKSDWKKWRESLLPAVKSTMGHMPEK